MLDHVAPSAIAPVGADLRVVARVRMVTPDRRVSNMRVAMRVTVTEQDEDERSLVRAIKLAIRTLALVAALVAALVVGAQPSQPAAAGPEAGDAAVVAGEGHELRDSPPASSVTTLQAMQTMQALAPSPAPQAAALAFGPWSPVATAERIPRPALAAGVIPSPD